MRVSIVLYLHYLYLIQKLFLVKFGVMNCYSLYMTTDEILIEYRTSLQ